MVLPGDELTVKLRHIGMRDGNIVVNVETSNARGIHLVIPLVYFSQRSLRRSHLSSLRRLRLRTCVSKATVDLAHNLFISIPVSFSFYS
jgi:hypothetical protein